MRSLILLIFALAAGIPSDHAAVRKVIWVDAYHPELEWSQGILKGIRSGFEERLTDGSLQLKTIYLDTKNKPGDAFAMQSAQRAHQIIQEEKPDLVIGGDDATAKFLIQKYYANTSLPIVFCGVNFNAAKYGFKGREGASNVTGIVEVPPVDLALKTASKYAPGNRYAYITYDDLSELGNFDGIINQFKINIPENRVAYVSTMEEWKTAYLKLQPQVDTLILGSANFMQGWDWHEAHAFILNNTSKEGGIPITYNHWTIDIALLAYSKRATEQGEWAARAAIEILFHGKQPHDIPFGRNREADLLLNETLARKLDIQFAEKDLEEGQLVTTPIH